MTQNTPPDPFQMLGMLKGLTGDAVDLLMSKGEDPEETLHIFLGGLGLKADKPIDFAQAMSVRLLMPPVLKYRLCPSIKLEVLLFESYEKLKEATGFVDLFRVLNELQMETLLEKADPTHAYTVAVDSAVSILLRTCREIVTMENDQELRFSAIHNRLLSKFVENGHKLVARLRECDDDKKQFEGIQRAQETYGGLAKTFSGFQG